MLIATADRLKNIGEYYFSQKLREIEQLNQQGKKIINLGIGSPDLPPHESVIEVLHTEASKPGTHAYQGYKGNIALRNAIAGFYSNWYKVSLNPDEEILPLIGSKEGIMHICMTYLNKGDKVLIPNPGYPTYRSAVKLAGGECVEYGLTDKTNWEPDINELETMVNAATVERGGVTTHPFKLLWVNYPHMPTGKAASIQLFERLIAFGKKYNILICHDNPYSFILNEQPLSILSVEGAKEVAVELNSLSKASNMAGWRVGMLVGSKERINDILTFKSNMDSGMFLPVQLAAVKALQLNEDWYTGLNSIYRERRESVYRIMDTLNCTYDTRQVGLFVWGRIAAGYKDGYALCDDVLYNKGVFVTPGGIFGSNGNGYIRISLCAKKEVFDQALERIQQ